MTEVLLSTFETTMMIVGFVMVMMLFIEYLNVESKGRWSQKLFKTPLAQILSASCLGVIPGCLGGFAAVSLYTHGMISFGALVSAMIASSGDEAFVMYALFPDKAIFIQLILLAIAIIGGVLTNMFFPKYKPTIVKAHHFEIHHHELNKNESETRNIWERLKYNCAHLSFVRCILIVALVSFIFKLIFIREEASDLTLFSEHDLNLLFAGLSICTLFIILTADEHFLEDHLWHHVIKKHFPRIFLWTLGSLLLIHFIEMFIDVDSWISSNQLSVLMIAILIGIIPESGPHLIFVTLFSQGMLPLSILLASSIVQDGHSGIPLLAESKRSFVGVKGINMVIGTIIGLVGYIFNF